MKKWLPRRLLEPLLALLRAGLAPRQLALCIAIAIVVGNIPILGVSTILCAIIAPILRLNLPAILLVQAAMAALHLSAAASIDTRIRADGRAGSPAANQLAGIALLVRQGASRLYLTHIATSRGNEKSMINRERRLLTGSWIFGSWIFAMACIVSGSIAPAIAAAPKSKFALSSSDPQLAISVPLIYTAKAFGCSGGNLSPELHWSGAPPGTQSFVLTLFDRDERSTPSGWWHWVVYDLSKTTTNLPQGAGAEHSSALPAGTLQGRTDLGEDAYHGPCPAEGDPPHRYVFTIYALNVAQLPVPADSSGAMVTSIVQEHLLGKAVFVAHYGRPKK